MMRRATVIIGRHGMGLDATEEDFDLWYDYVRDHLDIATRLDIDFDLRRPGDVQTDDIRAENEADRQAIHEALQSLWLQWCEEAKDQTPAPQ